MKILRTCKGFTLIESLFVLTVFLIIGGFVFLKMNAIYEQKIIDQFFRQLESDLYYAQQYAMVHQEHVNIYFNSDNHYYQANRYAFKGELFHTTYDKGITIQLMTLSQPITFYPNGSIRKGGTMFVYYHNEVYKVVFTIGKGRFRVEKL